MQILYGPKERPSRVLYNSAESEPIWYPNDLDEPNVGGWPGQPPTFGSSKSFGYHWPGAIGVLRATIYIAAREQTAMTSAGRWRPVSVPSLTINCRGSSK